MSGSDELSSTARELLALLPDGVRLSMADMQERMPDRHPQTVRTARRELESLRLIARFGSARATVYGRVGLPDPESEPPPTGSPDYRLTRSPDASDYRSDQTTGSLIGSGSETLHPTRAVSGKDKKEQEKERILPSSCSSLVKPDRESELQTTGSPDYRLTRSPDSPSDYRSDYRSPDETQRPETGGRAVLTELLALREAVARQGVALERLSHDVESQARAVERLSRDLSQALGLLQALTVIIPGSSGAQSGSRVGPSAPAPVPGWKASDSPLAAQLVRDCDEIRKSDPGSFPGFVERLQELPLEAVRVARNHVRLSRANGGAMEHPAAVLISVARGLAPAVSGSSAADGAVARMCEEAGDADRAKREKETAARAAREERARQQEQTTLFYAEKRDLAPKPARVAAGGAP